MLFTLLMIAATSRGNQAKKGTVAEAASAAPREASARRTDGAVFLASARMESAAPAPIPRM